MEFSEVRDSRTPIRGISRSPIPLIARYYKQSLRAVSGGASGKFRQFYQSIKKAATRTAG